MTRPVGPTPGHPGGDHAAMNRHPNSIARSLGPLVEQVLARASRPPVRRRQRQRAPGRASLHGFNRGAAAAVDHFIASQLSLLDEFDQGEEMLAFLFENWGEGLTVRAIGTLVLYQCVGSFRETSASA